MRGKKRSYKKTKKEEKKKKSRELVETWIDDTTKKIDLTIYLGMGGDKESSGKVAMGTIKGLGGPQEKKATGRSGVCICVSVCLLKGGDSEGEGERRRGGGGAEATRTGEKVTKMGAFGERVYI